MKIMNAFSLNMVDGDCDISIKTISWDEADRLIKEGESCIGHADLANLIGVETNRVTVKLNVGETALVIQHVGERLPEGCTELPEGSKLIPKLVTIN